MKFQDIYALKIGHFHGVLEKTYFGNISNNCRGKYPLMRLKFPFIASLSVDKYTVFICKGNTIRILRYGEQYLIFNPHCRNEQEIFSSERTSIVVKKWRVRSQCTGKVTIHINNISWVFVKWTIWVALV